MQYEEERWKILGLLAYPHHLFLVESNHATPWAAPLLAVWSMDV